MGVGLALLNRLAGVKALDRFGLRAPVQRTVFQATKTGFRTLGAATRTFGAVKPQARPERLATQPRRALFDLTPTDEQRLIQQAAREFGAEQLRPAASEADSSCQAPAALLERATGELGISFVGVPESLGGAGTERSAITGVLIAEALAHGDLGLAVALLAPAAVSTALVLWGDEQQQARYLPSFVADDAPAAALAVLEPRPLFDPFVLKTTARPSAGGYLLDGVKSLVPGAARAELFVIAAELPGEGPALFLVEADSAGLIVEAEPAMGLRAASMGRLVLDGVTVPASNLLAGDTAPGRATAYADCIRLSRLGWAALAVGTAQAVLDYVIPYVNERAAFGEPISNRQSVAFMVADLGIELEGMRLATYRAASRAEQGRSFARETMLARTLTGEYGMQIGSNGVQLLGGHGFVKEHPVERWYRDLRAAGLMEGAVLI
ncbi:MAG: acyl-CoA dehydrogenase family protein [Actinomycetota bacterium]|nr:acyl-CoA dehydrogenase family protein [Actinomycetota bacterium]MDQ2956787.1 acyl-CoA dehydrogenase family protein [Actinomycetota bacterium]